MYIVSWGGFRERSIEVAVGEADSVSELANSLERQKQWFSVSNSAGRVSQEHFGWGGYQYWRHPPCLGKPIAYLINTFGNPTLWTPRQLAEARIYVVVTARLMRVNGNETYMELKDDTGTIGVRVKPRIDGLSALFGNDSAAPAPDIVEVEGHLAITAPGDRVEAGKRVVIYALAIRRKISAEHPAQHQISEG